MAPKINGFWGIYYLDNSTQTFLFKLHNNTLGLNSRTALFVAGQSKNCTFCTLTRNPEDEAETPLHLFFQCRHTEPVILGTLRWLIDQDLIFNNLARSNFFGTYNTGLPARDFILQLASNLIKKFIWDCKVRFCIPTLQGCKDCLKGELDRIITHSKKIRETYDKSN